MSGTMTSRTDKITHNLKSEQTMKFGSLNSYLRSWQ